MEKTAQRTTMPFIDGLSPATQRSNIVPLFGDTPLIHDILRDNPDGGRNYKLHGGGNWSSGEDDGKSYREKGDDYKITNKILEMLKRNPGRIKKERWVGVDYEGKRHEFPSYEAFQRKLRKGDSPFRSVSKLAQKENIIIRGLKACVLIESADRNTKNREVGAGFCIGNGLFITCAHVIHRYDKMNIPAGLDENSLDITLHQKGNRFSGALVAADLNLDLAIVQSEADLPALQIGDSKASAIGDHVFAVGSPGGYENNLTEGVMSSRNRKVFFYPEAPNYIFTDAQVLPGSSGGPLISYEQKSVIGMMSLIVGGQGLYGLNAALPSEYIKEFLNKNRLL